MMATGFDELVEQLLYDVALSGSQGLGADELERAVKAFYESRQDTSSTQRLSEEDLLFSDAPPTNLIVIDETFLDAVWGWLEKHPEIAIRTDEDGPDPTTDSKHAGQRIFTSEERTWQVIAGHGVDRSRLPKSNFECLCVIAAHGPKGILQPSLTQITRQDKRSVPGRTDSLAENGYIIKLQAYDGRHKTSLLKLKKFENISATTKPISPSEQTRMHPQEDHGDDQELDKDDRTFDEVIQMLKENGGTVAIVDLCHAYKLRKNTAIKKHFLLSLDRLVECGCARQTNAQVKSGNNRYMACLQLVREPTEQDRAAFKGRTEDLDHQNDDPNRSPGTQTDGVDQVSEYIDDEAENDEDVADDTAEGAPRMPPQWTHDIPPNNLIFNIIDNAGPTGISSMDLHKQSMGTFWKKSLDDQLLRLTDVWQTSQPSHLKHLGIVRDTEAAGRSSHFHFRTLPNFERAVELGLTAWEAVTDQAHDEGKKKLGRPVNSMPSPESDKFGFPKLDAKLFADVEGRATLAKCAEPARKAKGWMKNVNDSPLKCEPRAISKTPTTISSVSPAETKKRKYVRKQKVALNLANTSPVESKLTPTGRKKRKDAGVKKKWMGSSLSNVSPAMSESEELLGQDPDELNASGDSGTTVVTPTSSGKKRQASSARLRESPRSRKARKVDEAPSTPPTQHDDEDKLESPARQIIGSGADSGEATHSRVSFNSPDALKLRFQNHKRSGRRPNAKVAVFKSERLKELQWFNPYIVGSVTQPERNVAREEVESVGSDDEPAQKRNRLEDGGVNGFSMTKIFGDTPTKSLKVPKKSGRPPKRKSGDIPDLAGTPASITPSELAVSAPTTPRSVIAKLPLRRSLLERFKQQSQDKDVEIVETPGRPSRIVTMPLPRAVAEAERSPEDSTPTRENRRLSGSNALTNTSATEVESRPSKMIKLSLPHSRSSATDEVPRRTKPPATAHMPEAVSRPSFGLNIIKPYLGPHSNNEVSGSVDQLGDRRLVDENSGDTPGTADDDNEDIGFETDDLSVLLPTGVDDSYKENVIQKAGTPRQGGFIHIRRARIVMDTMRKAGGAFPGDHEMWYPFVTAWQKIYPHLPDRRTIENAVNLLVKQKELNRFSFTFKDSKGNTLQKHILAEAGLGPNSPKVKEVQRLMIESYPFRYLPKQVPIAKHLRDRARRTPVTQGGTRTINGQPKVHDATYIPSRTIASDSGIGKRSRGASVSFDLNSQVLPTQTPQVTRVASFTPRSILKFKGDIPEQKPINLEEDDFDSDEETETSSESDNEDESASEVSPEQTAMQGSFGLRRYQHKAATTPRARQGTRAMVSLKVGKEGTTIESKSPSKAQLKATQTTLNRSTQVFHTPSGTFGTVFKQKSKASRKRQLITPNIHVTPSKVNKSFSAPQKLEDILNHPTILGRRGTNPSDSRLYQFKHQINGVKAWEGAIISADSTIHAPTGAVFINHGLKQQHELATDPEVSFAVEFVDGSSKPYLLDSERKKRSQTARRMSAGSDNATPTVANQYVSPYSAAAPTPTLTTTFSPQDSQTAQPPTVSSSPSSPAVRKTARQRVYKTRKTNGKRLTTEPANAASQFFDRDSDGDYRPSRAVSAKKRGAARKLVHQTGRRQAIYNKFGPVDFKRLALAVALARTICGGIGSFQVTNYEAVALAFGGNHEAEDLRQYWALPRKHGYDLAFAKKLQQVMYEPFLMAYENGELPRVDFDDLQNTEWAALLEWADAKVSPLVEANPVKQLPTERGDLQAVPTNTSLSTLEVINNHDTLTAHSNLLAAPIRQRGQNLSKASSVLEQTYVLEKSWIRAAMNTRDEVYNETVAANKLSSISPTTLGKATQEMLNTKTIKWKKVDRQQPGRNFTVSPYATSQLDRWSRSHGSEFLSGLLAARADFVRHLQQHDQLELSADVTEAQLTVLTNMVAQGHVMVSPLLPERNDDIHAPDPKWSKWGTLKEVYDNEQSELPALDVKVVYKKTSLFTSDHGLKLDVPISTDVPSFLGEYGTRIPFWIDINGNVIHETWSKVVESILHLLVHAPGCTANSIERAHDSKLWEWEIDIVLEWMEAVGLAKQTCSGKSISGAPWAGWRASELWHCASLVTGTTSAETSGGNDMENGEVVET